MQAEAIHSPGLHQGLLKALVSQACILLLMEPSAVHEEMSHNHWAVLQRRVRDVGPLGGPLAAKGGSAQVGLCI